MGCDIHSFAEVKRKGKWEIVKDKGGRLEPFDWRSYSTFAFLAGVRNYDHCTPISEPRGLPSDSEFLNSISHSEWGMDVTEKEEIEERDFHSFSHLYLKELLNFNYDKTFWNRRISKTIYREDGSISGSNGACIAEEGEGEIVSYKDNLGESFFIELNNLKKLGNPEDVRIVFWFSC